MLTPDSNSADGESVGSDEKPEVGVAVLRIAKPRLRDGETRDSPFAVSQQQNRGCRALVRAVEGSRDVVAVVFHGQRAGGPVQVLNFYRDVHRPGPLEAVVDGKIDVGNLRLSQLNGAVLPPARAHGNRDAIGHLKL